MKEEQIEKQQELNVNELQKLEEINLSKEMICREVISKIPEIKLLGLTLLQKAIGKLSREMLLEPMLDEVMTTIKIFIFHS